jgi:quercetin dioxygenase-like cupin family protein
MVATHGTTPDLMNWDGETADAEYLIPAGAGEAVALGGLGVVYKLTGAETGGAFAVVEHPLAPGCLGAPPHTHAHEDEISFVLEGEIGVQIGDAVFTAGPGSYVFKPRGVPHAFWNPGPVPARFQEIITPAGFEGYFREAAEALAGGGPPDVARLQAIAARYGLTLHFDRLEPLMRAQNVRLS